MANRYSTDSIELDWCRTHNEWYVDNNNGNDECPKCVARQVSDENDKTISNLQQTIDEQADKILELDTELESKGDE